MSFEAYEFPGWDRCLRCLCHGQDDCPDLEHLYSLQQEAMWWKNLSDEERLEIETLNAAWAISEMFRSLCPSEVMF